MIDFSAARVAVVGDIIRDRWVYGRVERINPEAPVPVLEVERVVEMPGGAGNVAANMVALGATPALFGHQPEPSLKTRYVGNGQQMLRVDDERIVPIDSERVSKILDELARINPRVIVLSDYGKGICTQELCRRVLIWSAGRAKVVVDPKGEWRRYAGADLITPNSRELMDLYTPPWRDSTLGEKLEWLRIRAVLETQGASGMTLHRWGSEHPPLHIDATGPEVIDVTGAGDTVVAVMALCMAIDMELEKAMVLANRAAGIVVGKRGTATCSLKELEGA